MMLGCSDGVFGNRAVGAAGHQFYWGLDALMALSVPVIILSNVCRVLGALIIVAEDDGQCNHVYGLPKMYPNFHIGSVMVRHPWGSIYSVVVQYLKWVMI